MTNNSIEDQLGLRGVATVRGLLDQMQSGIISAKVSLSDDSLVKLVKHFSAIAESFDILQTIMISEITAATESL